MGEEEHDTQAQEPTDAPPLADQEPEQVSAECQEALAAQLAVLPPSPGCYIFLGDQGAVLYVGKAKSLRSRVRSYFQDHSTDTRAFLPWLRRAVVLIETIVTATEKEAAVLESGLIKERRPKYNVKLRDDKEYLSLRIDPSSAWPRLEVVRRPSADGARYFGPYPSATGARRTMRLAERHFHLRTCSDRELRSRKRPCIKYQIKRCPAPCVLDVDETAYQAQVRAVGLFLEGRHDDVSKVLEERMRVASQSLDFELAATLRDQMRAIAEVRERQRVVTVSDRDLDVVGLYREHDRVELAILNVRSGRVVDVIRFSDLRAQVEDSEVIATFLRVHYDPEGGRASVIPDEVLVPLLPEGAEGVESWLSELRRARSGQSGFRLTAPQRGRLRDLVGLAEQNAHHAFDQQRQAAVSSEGRLAQLQKRLRLPREPSRIECVDISHTGGQDCIGAVVALRDARPDKSHYRTYHVKTAEPGNDYQAMFEVLSRRLRRGVEETEEAPVDEAWSLPDLLVVDGGRGQLQVALTVVADLGITDLPVVGLAKEKETALGAKVVDRVYLPGQKNPIPLGPTSSELRILALARDEAHRFSNRGRKRAAHARQFASALDEVPGIGEKTRRALLAALGSLRGVLAASDEALLAVRGVGKKQVAALRAHFGPPAAVADGELGPKGDHGGEFEPSCPR